MNFVGQALPLKDGDVRTIAGYLGCQIAAVRAVMQIEAAGKGFDAKGRPKMLFEPHIFYRELKAGAKRNQAVAEGLAYAKWKAGSYPSDSYPRLLRAMAIDETAALRSASWGAGQVMGFNHKAAGFDTVQAFVRAMTVSEGAHLYAMARFIVTNKLQRHLRDLNWTGFAKGYNGSGYAQNGYHTKMKAAYQARPAREKVTPPPATEAELQALYTVAKPVPAPSPAPTPTPRPEPAPAPAQGLWAALATAIRNLFSKG